jgi:hypothetical protein
MIKAKFMVRRSRVRPAWFARCLLLASIALLAPAAAHARPRLYSMTCAFGDGRTHVLPRRVEAGSDDPLYCWVDVANVSGRQAPRLTGELRAQARGRARPLVLGAFDPRDDRAHRAVSELAVPHDEWFSRVDWSSGRPRLRLVLTVYDSRGSARRERWQRLFVSRLDVGHRRNLVGTPSFKNNYLASFSSPFPRPAAPAPRRSRWAARPAPVEPQMDYPPPPPLGRDDNP